MLEVKNLHKQYDVRGTVAIGDISFRVEPGEFLSIVGPSGAGKTTLLRCIAGLLAPTRGSVAVAGHPVTSPPPEMAVVFQDYNRSLFPWMNVRNNVLFALKKQRHITAARKQELAQEMLTAVGLGGFERHYPWELSGGMQQRVAIGQALMANPRMLLMDEPFGALDALTRDRLNVELLRMWQQDRKTVMLITHSIPEAIFLADRVIVMSARPGRVIENLRIDLPRPRDPKSTRELPEFGHYVVHLGELMGVS